MRASTEGFQWNLPTELFSRNGAVDHKLISDGRTRIAAAAGRQFVLDMGCRRWDCRP